MPDDLLYETLKQNQKYQMIDDILDFLNYASESVTRTIRSLYFTVDIVVVKFFCVMVVLLSYFQVNWFLSGCTLP